MTQALTDTGGDAGLRERKHLYSKDLSAATPYNAAHLATGWREKRVAQKRTPNLATHARGVPSGLYVLRPA